jgi:diguanylate cyclase (GGDEF)-like protein
MSCSSNAHRGVALVIVRELRSKAAVQEHRELLEALKALVEQAEVVASRTASTTRLDQAVARWSRDVPTPGDVVSLLAEVRRDSRLLRSREEILERVAVVAVAHVAQRQVGEALTDPLTGLATRARMEDEIQHLLAMSLRAGSPLTAVILDVDGLKQINDERGHAAGDAALAAVGKAIRDHARMTDRAFRWGGDEFVVLMPSTTEYEARLVVDRIQDSCATRTTAGVATHADGTGDGDIAAWLSAADADLYRTRNARRTAASRPSRRLRSPRQASGIALLGIAMLVAATGGVVGAVTAGHTGGSARTGGPVTQALGPLGSGSITRPSPPAAAPAARPAAVVKHTSTRVTHRTVAPHTASSLPRIVPVVVAAVPPVTPPVVTTPVVPPPPSEQTEQPSVVGGLITTVQGVLRSLVSL